MSADAEFRPGDRVIFTDSFHIQHTGEVVRTKPHSVIMRFDDDEKEYNVRADMVRSEE